MDAVATRATINAGGPVRDWSPLRTLPNKEHRFDPVVVEGGPFATKERERAKEAQKNELKMAMDALRRETAAYERDLRELVKEDRDRRQFSLEHRGRPTISVY